MDNREINSEAFEAQEKVAFFHRSEGYFTLNPSGKYPMNNNKARLRNNLRTHQVARDISSWKNSYGKGDMGKEKMYDNYKSNLYFDRTKRTLRDGLFENMKWDY